MPITVSILRRRAQSSEPHHLAGILALDEDMGLTDMVVVDESSRKSLDVLRLGVWQKDLKHSVTPTDGLLYIEAIEAYFAHSTDWRAAPRLRLPRTYSL